MDPIENFPHHPQFLQSTIGSGDVMWKNHEEPQLALPEDQTISFGTSANVVWYCSCSLVCDMGFSLRKEVSSWTWGAEQKSYGGIQSAVRHSSTASSKRPRFDCISMRLVDLVGLILLGGWKEVSERCFVGKMALHQTENTFYTVVCQHLSSLSPSFKSHHLHFAECCQEFGAGIEPTPEKLYEPGSPGDSFFPPGFFDYAIGCKCLRHLSTRSLDDPGGINVYLVASWLWLWPILLGGLEHECYIFPY